MAKRRRSNTGIPGLSFSWKRAFGITRARQRIARATGIPTTRSGLERKIGRIITGRLARSRRPRASATAGCGCLMAWLALLIVLVILAF